MLTYTAFLSILTVFEWDTSEDFFFLLPFSGKNPPGNIQVKPLDFRASNGQKYPGKRLQPRGEGGGGGGYSRNMVNGVCAALMGDFSAKSP